MFIKILFRFEFHRFFSPFIPFKLRYVCSFWAWFFLFFHFSFKSRCCLVIDGAFFFQKFLYTNKSFGIQRETEEKKKKKNHQKCNSRTLLSTTPANTCPFDWVFFFVFGNRYSFLSLSLSLFLLVFFFFCLCLCPPGSHSNIENISINYVLNMNVTAYDIDGWSQLNREILFFSLCPKMRISLAMHCNDESEVEYKWFWLAQQSHNDDKKRRRRIDNDEVRCVPSESVLLFLMSASYWLRI